MQLLMLWEHVHILITVLYFPLPIQVEDPHTASLCPPLSFISSLFLSPESFCPSRDAEQRGNPVSSESDGWC